MFKFYKENKDHVHRKKDRKNMGWLKNYRYGGTEIVKKVLLP
jgi:hypothetical protein